MVCGSSQSPRNSDCHFSCELTSAENSKSADQIGREQSALTSNGKIGVPMEDARGRESEENLQPRRSRAAIIRSKLVRRHHLAEATSEDQ
jgi:hypothetical protein